MTGEGMMIPLFKPEIGEKEKAAVRRVLTTGVLSRGVETSAFEREFAEYLGFRHAVAVNSGTSALHLLVRCMGWREGDEVVTTSFSYVASANVLLMERVTPVFADIDPVTWNIDLDDARRRMSSATNGALLVHILGCPLDFQRCQQFLSEFGLGAIEDACEALGPPSKGFPIGRVGIATAYSFFANKQLTSGGEGGMVITDDAEISRICRSLRDQGRADGCRWLDEVRLGYNYRMTELQAAFGRAQLRRLPSALKRRKELADTYTQLLAPLTNALPPSEPASASRSWFVYPLLFETPELRDRVAAALAAGEVEASTTYFPVIPAFGQYRALGYNPKDFPVAARTSRCLLALPLFPSLRDSEVQHIVGIIQSVCE